MYNAHGTYRVSHEIGQLVNSFECLLLYIALDFKDFLQFISLKKHLFLKLISHLNQFYFNMIAI